MQYSNMFDVGAMHHVPVVRNAENVHVFQDEQYLRVPDVTNSIDDLYEYSQPKTYRLSSNANFQVNNPFNTPCQFMLLYARVNDNAAYLAINVDNADTSALNLTTNILDFPGILLSQTSTSPLAPSVQWIDFQNFLQVRCQGITTFTEFCLVFRRKTHQTIPQNIIPFNGPEQ